MAKEKDMKSVICHLCIFHRGENWKKECRYLHPLRKQLIAKGIRVVVLSSSAIMYLANLPLRLAVVSIVSSCFNSLRALSDDLVSLTSTTLMSESFGVGWMASSGIGDMQGLPFLLLEF